MEADVSVRTTMTKEKTVPFPKGGRLSACDVLPGDDNTSCHDKTI